MIRVGNTQLVEEQVGHARVVVLASVNQSLVMADADSLGDRRRLDELWTGADHRGDPHWRLARGTSRTRCAQCARVGRRSPRDGPAAIAPRALPVPFRAVEP